MTTRAYVLILAIFASFALSACSEGRNPNGFPPPTIPSLGNDASLTALEISAGTLMPDFMSTTTNYTAAVSFLQSTIVLSGAASDPAASAEVNGVPVSGGASDPIPLAEGANVITVTITAEDGITTESYTIDVTRASANTFAQQAYLKAANTDAGDGFGWSVALNGDTLAVGAYLEDSASVGINANGADNTAVDAGAVYVFIRDSAGTWRFQAYIKASNTGAGDNFGSTVELYDDTLAVGARFEDSAAAGIGGDQSDNSAVDSGAVYVFTRDQAGVWSQQAYVKASNPDAGDRFGRSLSLNGNSLAVGAHLEDSAAVGIGADQTDNSLLNAGAAYVFTRDGAGSWAQQAYVKSSNTDAGDNFGLSVAVYDNTLAVGAQNEDGAGSGIGADQSDNSAVDAGAVYVFIRDGAGTWSQQSYVKASNTDIADNFGWDVALYENTLVASALSEDSAGTGIGADESDNTASNSGAAYILNRDGSGIWTQRAYIKSSNTDVNDKFGQSLALSDSVLAISSQLEDSAATGINGDQLDNSASKSGAVYVFVEDGLGGLTQAFYLKTSNAEALDNFDPVAVSGGTVVGGAPGEDSSSNGVNGVESDNSALGAGAAYVFN